MLLAAACSISTPATAQEWLFGKKRTNSGPEVKFTSTYQKDGRIRVSARGGPFDRVDQVSRAAVGRLAEMARDKGMPRSAVLKEQCWIKQFGGADCTIQAVMLTADQPAPEAVPTPTVISVETVLPSP
ncbi:hypothetical protein SAMN05192580_3617 [Sphingomonas jatrophae]|uniref:Uncharacterized protein n=2 Tax=Sphingomonas jatrophae TaxID=1166337 RepID=A0A1I6M7Q1_9SPHN|nr:hypothetical protein SAMN05192580_3617 [Sphingomonas jatrophae]